jgi:hypothetical protein
MHIDTKNDIARASNASNPPKTKSKTHIPSGQRVQTH